MRERDGTTSKPVFHVRAAAGIRQRTRGKDGIEILCSAVGVVYEPTAIHFIETPDPDAIRVVETDPPVQR